MATKGTRKPKAPPTVTTVGVNINGAYINIENVDVKKAGPTLAALLDVFRALMKKYPELRTIHPTLGGYSPLEYEESWADWDERRRKIGFQ